MNLPWVLTLARANSLISGRRYSARQVRRYPKPIFDKATGVIDKAVAAYWKEHYDLSAILQRDWPTLGPKVQGKLHIYVGSADTYFLTNAVYYLEDFLKRRTIRPTMAKSSTVIAPNTAGTGIRICPTICPGSITTRCMSEDSGSHATDRTGRSGHEFMAILR